MIFEISFSMFNFFLLFFLHFFKTVIFGYFWFLAKNTPKLQELLKKRSKSSICPIIFHISLKKIHFSTLTFFFGPLTWNRPNVSFFIFFFWLLLAHTQEFTSTHKVSRVSENCEQTNKLPTKFYLSMPTVFVLQITVQTKKYSFKYV